MSNFANNDPESKMRLISPDEFLDTMASYVESGEWWVIIVGFDMTDVIEAIETTYYPPGTEKNKDFHLVILPFPAIAFAKKVHMNRDQLVRNIMMFTGTPPDIPEGTDILVLIEKDDRLGKIACERLLAQMNMHMELRGSQKGMI